MTETNGHGKRLGAVRKTPLQAVKFVGILLALILAIAGFLRIIDAPAIADGPLLSDGQFLALVLLPLASLGLVVVVFAETVVSGYRSIQSDRSLREQMNGRYGYLVLRSVEAGLALLGVVIMFAATPSLFAESTPAPAGVGIMLLLFVVGFGILFVSFLRSTAELFVY